MTTSYNGWPASTSPTAIGIDPGFTVAGHKFPGGVKKGDVETVFRFFLGNYHLRVESLGLDSPDEWGYVYRLNRNANNLSCHSSGTAVDVNAQRHPNGSRNTLSVLQVTQLRKIQGWISKVLRWGGDFSTTKDEMHHEVCVNAATLHVVAARLARPRFTKTLKVGVGSLAHPDAEVKKYQGWLGVKADGVFGPITATATKRTQARLAMTQTGVVGPQLAFFVNP